MLNLYSLAGLLLFSSRVSVAMDVGEGRMRDALPDHTKCLCIEEAAFSGTMYQGDDAGIDKAGYDEMSKIPQSGICKTPPIAPHNNGCNLASSDEWRWSDFSTRGTSHSWKKSKEDRLNPKKTREAFSSPNQLPGSGDATQKFDPSKNPLSFSDEMRWDALSTKGTLKAWKLKYEPNDIVSKSIG